MILIRFPDADSKRKALGRLPGRFAFKSWATGEMMVPEDALAFLAVEGVPFTVGEPASGLGVIHRASDPFRGVGS